MTIPTRLWTTGAALIWAAFVLTGCTETKRVAAKSSDVLVGLQRTSCYGTCPVYELSVTKTGEATLKVGPHCEPAFGRALEQGMHRAQVELGEWNEVVEMAYEMGFDTLKSRYDDPRIMDVPANIVTVNGKTVYNRYGGPRLNLLYLHIERLVGTVDWKADPEIAR